MYSLTVNSSLFPGSFNSIALTSHSVKFGPSPLILPDLAALAFFVLFPSLSSSSDFASPCEPVPDFIEEGQAILRSLLYIYLLNSILVMVLSLFSFSD